MRLLPGQEDDGQDGERGTDEGVPCERFVEEDDPHGRREQRRHDGVEERPPAQRCLAVDVELTRHRHQPDAEVDSEPEAAERRQSEPQSLHVAASEVVTRRVYGLRDHEDQKGPDHPVAPLLTGKSPRDYRTRSSMLPSHSKAQKLVHQPVRIEPCVL